MAVYYGAKKDKEAGTVGAASLKLSRDGTERILCGLRFASSYFVNDYNRPGR